MANASAQSPPSKSKALIVNLGIFILWLILTTIELWLWIPMRALKALSALLVASTSAGHRDRRKTVVIVGGNFSGLAALGKLSSHADLFRIVLIDQQDYFEYTPGTLRLFCEPELFPTLAHPLARDSSTHQVLQGKVTSIVEEGSGVSNRAPQKTLSYQHLGGPLQKLHYDYLIMATGATYAAPISAMPNVTTFSERFGEWKSAHTRLRQASRVIILGGGAVGVELAAEIVDYFPSKRVTLLDAQRALVTNFPETVGNYAHRWLSSRGVQLRLGQQLESWNETSCTLQDGTVLQADMVYVCFGNRPNSAALDTPSKKYPLLDERRNISVDSFLRLKNSPVQDGSIFACGDVANPPNGAEKQAMQAEVQGKVAARNVLKTATNRYSTPSLEGNDLCRYPLDVAGSHQMPLIFILSLGRHDGALGFNGLIIPGPLAAIAKWVLEYTKVLDMQGRFLGTLIWGLADKIVLFLSRTLIKPVPNKQV